MSMTTEAYERIRDAIVSGALEFGEPLSETQIAAALGMSKAPVRAAFIELRDKGLVTVVPQSGTYVFSPTADDVRTMSHFRALLEDHAMREATRRNPDNVQRQLREAIAAMRRAIDAADWESYRRHDSAFHFTFLAEAENRYVEKAYLLTSTALEALRVRLQRGKGNFRIRSFNEHVSIADDLRDGAVDKAAALLRYHILIINEWVDTLTLGGERTSRKDKSDDRDYGLLLRRA
jgi:DNA-binding GntR family transcriptional regulator